MKKILKSFGAFLAAILVGLSMAAAPVYADVNEMNSELCSRYGEGGEAADPVLYEAAGCRTQDSALVVGSRIVQVAISVAGVVAVVVIVIAGQRFMSANGDASRVAAAKNMLMYAIIGLIIAVLSFAVVTFVSQAIQNNANSGSEYGLVLEAGEERLS